MTARRSHQAVLPARRGFVILYRRGETNVCPGCGGTHWWIGRASAECARCASAFPLMSPVATGPSTEGTN